MWQKLSLFGLGHCDLPTLLWNVDFMLRGVTLNIDNRFDGRIPLLYYITTAILAVSYFYTYFLSMLWFVFVRCIETGDLAAAMIVFPLGITSQIGVAKFINTNVYRAKIRDLFQSYMQYDSKIKTDSRFYGNLLKSLRSVKKRALTIWIIIVSNGLLYILKPLVMPGRRVMEDIFTLYKLEPTLDTPNYQLNYLLSALGSVLTCYLTSNMAAFVILGVGYVESQLLAFSEELLHLWDDAEQEYFSTHIGSTPNVVLDDDDDQKELKNKAINKEIHNKLCSIIQGHTTSMNFLLQFAAIFKNAFAYEFLILSAGLIAELLGGLENTYMEVPFALIQVGMDCLTGQRLIDACEVFEEAVYGCKWEQFSASNMKTVFLMLMNSQKTLQLSAGGIAVLNFVTLMSVIRSVYSAFTTLQSVL